MFLRCSTTLNNYFAIHAINIIINDKITDLYGTFDRQDSIEPIKYKGDPGKKEFLAIIENQQKRIITSITCRTNILMKINDHNLDRWYHFLKPIQNMFLEQAFDNDASFPYRYYAAKSVFFPKELPFEDIICYLDLNFGQNIFPDFTYEDAVVILFIKPIFPKNFDKNLERYQNDIRHYINYMAFALKKVIEIIENVKIPLFPDETDIVTLPASQYILLFLNKTYK